MGEDGAKFLKIDEGLHNQAHIYDVVPKQPLRVTQEECWRELEKAKPAVEPITTEAFKTGAKRTPGNEGSTTIINVTLKITESGESLSLPAWTSATAGDVSKILEAKLNTPEGAVRLVRKQGCSFKMLYHHDQIAPMMYVRGIKSFRRQPEKHDHPFAIIGAGHIGLRTAMTFLEKGESDFVVFDRMREVGGTSWWVQANSTSKLQTEYGVYHLDWTATEKIPSYFKTPWPSRDDLLKMFIEVTDRYGLRPHCRMCTEVKGMQVIKKPEQVSRYLPKCLGVDHYTLSLAKTDGEGRATWAWDHREQSAKNLEEFKTQGIAFFPGNLTLPRREVYKGEEEFDGQIEYAMFGNADYTDVPGKDVLIVGHGAFAVENVRTCCEFHSGKIYLLCRRKNIACPRVVSWFLNRSFVPVSASLYLRSMQPMYDFLGWSPWDYYAVKANANRSIVNIEQKARFGIGDIYFVAGYYGKMEVVTDNLGVKRVSHHQVTLGSGRKLDVQVIFKALGFVGEPANDKLMQLKELVGFWVNEDPRRYIVAEPVSVMAQNFGGTSFSPGAILWACIGVHFLRFPQDSQPMFETGSLPRHAPDDSDEGTYRPGYVVDARHGNAAMMGPQLHCPSLAEEFAAINPIKPIKQRLCHPIKQYIEEAKADWDHYCEQFIKEGYDKPYPTYPYTLDVTRALVMLHMKEAKEPSLPCDLEDLGLDHYDVGQSGLLNERAYNKVQHLWDRFDAGR